MMTDLNDFKEINDTRGHMTGDAVLCHIAGILAEFARKSDVVCRFGGDEFVMIFPECSEEIVEARRDAIIKALEKRPCPFGEITGCVTMSFGIAMLPRDGATAEALLRAADEALYHDKKQKLRRSAQASMEQ
jgi:diguanylate cyclase (GGDEF)-like protein